MKAPEDLGEAAFAVPLPYRCFSRVSRSGEQESSGWGRPLGGFEVDFIWRDSKLGGATVRSLKGNGCRLRYADTVIEFPTSPGTSYGFDGALKRR